jgi:hypothetical protein
MSAAAITTLILTAVLIAALAFFLVWIAVVLVRAERALDGTANLLRAMARHTEPVNEALSSVADSLEQATKRMDEVGHETAAVPAEKV